MNEEQDFFSLAPSPSPVVPDKQLHFRRVIQIGGVAFVGVEVDFEFAGGVGSDEQVVEHDRTRG